MSTDSNFTGWSVNEYLGIHSDVNARSFRVNVSLSAPFESPIKSYWRSFDASLVLEFKHLLKHCQESETR